MADCRVSGVALETLGSWPNLIEHKNSGTFLADQGGRATPNFELLLALMEGELGIVRFLSDDRLQFDCNGQIPPRISHLQKPITSNRLGLHACPSLFQFPRSRVAPEKPVNLTGLIWALMRMRSEENAWSKPYRRSKK